MSSPTWLPAIKGYSKRTRAEKTEAERNHRDTHDRLRAIQRSADYKGCSDCQSRLAGWAALPHGVFVCIDCAQVHRSIGRHISQVKAVSTGTYTWYPDEVDAMQHMGNERANSIYCGRKEAPQRPPQSASRAQREAYIIPKYVQRRWALVPNNNSKESGPARFKPKWSPKTPKSAMLARSKATSINGIRSAGSTLRDELWNGTVNSNSQNVQLNILDDSLEFESCRSELRKPLQPSLGAKSQPVDFFAGFGV